MVQYTYFCGMHEACAVLRRVHIYLQLKRYKCLSKLGRVLALTYNINKYTKKVYDFPEGR